jgi:flagellar biosynthesis protein
MPESGQPPRRRATALRYEQGRHAPEVVATGAGFAADRILAAAREAGVPVRHDPALAQALAALDLGDEVPQALWTAVAETLAWAYRLDAGSRNRRE